MASVSLTPSTPAKSKKRNQKTVVAGRSFPVEGIKKKISLSLSSDPVTPTSEVGENCSLHDIITQLPSSSLVRPEKKTQIPSTLAANTVGHAKNKTSPLSKASAGAAAAASAAAAGGGAAAACKVAAGRGSSCPKRLADNKKKDETSQPPFKKHAYGKKNDFRKTSNHDVKSQKMFSLGMTTKVFYRFTLYTYARRNIS